MAAGLKHACDFLQEEARAFDMVQDIHHDDIGEASVGKRQTLRIADKIEPRRRHDVGADSIRCKALEVARASADLKGPSGHG